MYVNEADGPGSMGTQDNGTGTSVTLEAARLLMTAVLDPTADAIWDAVKTEMTLEGITEFEPQTDEEWAVVRNAAITLAESGNLLMIGSRARDQDDWIAWSRDLIAAGEKILTPAWQPVELGNMWADSGAKLKVLEDGSVLSAPVILAADGTAGFNFHPLDFVGQRQLNLLIHIQRNRNKNF